MEPGESRNSESKNLICYSNLFRRTFSAEDSTKNSFSVHFFVVPSVRSVVLVVDVSRPILRALTHYINPSTFLRTH